MSSVELLYDLRDVTDYIVASPTEIMIAGMPYEKLIPEIFSTAENYDIKERLAKISDIFVEYYESGEAYPNDEHKSATIAVTETSKIDALAAAVRDVFQAGVTEPNIADIQYLEKLYNHAFFDLSDYIHNICNDEVLLGRFDKALKDMTIFEDHTRFVFSGYGGTGNFEAKNVCGISSYIPREQFPVTRQAYYDTAWAKFTQPGGGI